MKKTIPPWSDAAAEAMKQRLSRLMKPPGSLGRLEDAAVKLAGMQDSVSIQADPAEVLLFAGDHGVAAAGVSPYPQQVTTMMLENFAAGSAAVNVLAGTSGVPVTAVDVGSSGELVPGVRDRRIRRGTRNLAEEAAMTIGECRQAQEAGASEVRRLQEKGIRLLLLGEMGIGNTTSTAALLSALTGQPAAALTGPGTGSEGEQLERKKRIAAAAAARELGKQPEELLASLGGLETAAAAGAVEQAAALRIPVLLDGFIITTAALCAVRMNERTADYLLAGHRSAEPGHDAALAELGLAPLLELEMRLGEGSGAAAAYPLLQMAASLTKNMALFPDD
ncbi:nicotinate-nucleotide--dimethylbenzimidazole phosphoribosyltransferase [Alkalicoccus chagannorensis]|uniref:nicotinate-nucleotide--dimethylbenzimidazole phosphoribosyltransferase n=1 Tax=Alkalicoccus chagannorensis TaxID=427072 RepID=UPI000417B517|nr:nicotinate-nucleotide--dimethylbenzimidazole phosphoribosyltransferase [Alkalicoccus chagannorensis]